MNREEAYQTIEHNLRAAESIMKRRPGSQRLHQCLTNLRLKSNINEIIVNSLGEKNIKVIK